LLLCCGADWVSRLGITGAGCTGPWLCACAAWSSVAQDGGDGILRNAAGDVICALCGDDETSQCPIHSTPDCPKRISFPHKDKNGKAGSAIETICKYVLDKAWNHTIQSGSAYATDRPIEL